jgi:hypothetical protein
MKNPASSQREEAPSYSGDPALSGFTTAGGSHEQIRPHYCGHRRARHAGIRHGLSIPRTGPEPTEAEMRAAVEGKTDAMKEHFQHLERHCRNMQGGSSIAGLRCLFGTFGTQAASNIKVGAFKKIQCRRLPPGWACQYIIHMDMGESGRVRNEPPDRTGKALHQHTSRLDSLQHLISECTYAVFREAGNCLPLFIYGSEELT